jgi:hypothetical protein
MKETEKLRRDAYDTLHRRVAGLIATEFAVVVGRERVAAYNAAAGDPRALGLLERARTALLGGDAVPPDVAEELEAIAARRVRHLL